MLAADNVVDGLASGTDNYGPIAAKLDRARVELLDLSARNRLLNMPRSAKSARTIELVDEVSAEVFRLLVTEGRTLTFLPGRGADEEVEDADEVAELAQPDDDSRDARGVFSRHADTRLQTRLTSKGLQSRLLDLYLDARTLEEEQGVNILFLAMGMLHWVDPTNATATRAAPLVLVPVRLERGAAGERFKLVARGEEPAANLSLETFLDRVHQITLPAFDTSEACDPAAYMANVAAAVASKADWRIEPDAMALGFFSFAKFLMYRDLDPALWPEGASLARHRLIGGLLGDGFTHPEGLLAEDAAVDEHLTPADMVHIVDADGSQTLAIHEARRGRDLVIQGPPGTGKSQTIANVIAGAIADGKTVLFVAEKMAALEVVKRRLDAAGVGDACLELHSNKANKRLLLTELKRTWELAAPRGGVPDPGHEVLAAREVLNAHAARLHEVHPTAGLTAYQVLGALTRLRAGGQPPVGFALTDAATWTPTDRARRRELVDELAARVEDIGTPGAHVWRGVQLTEVLPTDVDRIAEAMRELVARVTAFAGETARVAGIVEVSAPACIADHGAVDTQVQRVAGAPAIAPAALGDQGWADEFTTIDAAIETGQRHRALADELAPLVTEAANAPELVQHRDTLAALPGAVTEADFAHVHDLAGRLPRLLAGADKLAHALGVTPPRTLADLDQLTATAARVADAPPACPDAFASAAWDRGVEDASALTDAVARLGTVRGEIGERMSEQAWTLDLAPARAALAAKDYGFLKVLSGEWRSANRLVRSVLTSPPGRSAETVALLDRLAEGKAARARISEADAFGRAAFGSDWAGERSDPVAMRALVEWVRASRALGDQPRLIAARVRDRGEIRDRVDRVARERDDTRPLLDTLWDALGERAEAITGSDTLARAPLDRLAETTAALAAADGATRVAFVAVPATLGERLRVIQRILDRRAAAAKLADAQPLGERVLGAAWRGVASDWDALAVVARWCRDNADIRSLAARVPERTMLAARSNELVAPGNKLAADIARFFDRIRLDRHGVFATDGSAELPFTMLGAQFAAWLGATEQLSRWVAYLGRAVAARALGLDPLVDRLHGGALAPGQARASFEMAYHEALLGDMSRRTPELARFDGTLHDRAVRRFADLDLARIAAARLEVATAHHRRIPHGGGAAGPLGQLRAEIVRRRGHLPIRQLMARAGAAVQALKPVMMMSPLSVAQFLPPGALDFDLLVMDEASQIQPVDALGAIARAKQVIVVGDERQLPPTAFFAKMTAGDGPTDEEDAAPVADIESILGLFTAKGLPQRMLRWHYRSRHQSLIAVSNSQFYENKLYIVPSPYTAEAGMGLRFHHVAGGVFDTGNTRVNAVEARAVAEAILRHAAEHPEHSLGVATFSTSQRRAIIDELERLRRLNPATEAFFQAHAREPFFIKNLENVQGDERDVILISAGYGRNASGYMAMRFGPLSAEGGERRLNVLISRAKRRCDVYTSITDEDIDLERAKGKGVLAFKLFLHFARTGRLSIAQSTGRDHGSVFEAEVEAALAAKGFIVRRQVGIAGFFIDLAIVDPERPGRFVIGIECDGASYHSSRSARDRDRLRQAVLEDHGWTIHRIWSTDWFQRPVEQLARTVAAIEAATADHAATGARAGPAVPIEIQTIDRGELIEVGLAAIDDVAGGTAYVEASVAVPSAQYELHETPTGLMARIVADIVAIEGPVHVDEVIARVRTLWGLQRAGGRIQAAVEHGVARAITIDLVLRGGDFLTTPGGTVRVRDRGDAVSATLRRPEMLPPAEIAAAAIAIARRNLGARREEIVAGVARAVGFRAISARLRGNILAVVDALVANGTLVEQGGMLTSDAG